MTELYSFNFQNALSKCMCDGVPYDFLFLSYDRKTEFKVNKIKVSVESPFLNALCQLSDSLNSPQAILPEKVDPFDFQIILDIIYKRPTKFKSWLEFDKIICLSLYLSAWNVTQTLIELFYTFIEPGLAANIYLQIHQWKKLIGNKNESIKSLLNGIEHGAIYIASQSFDIQLTKNKEIFLSLGRDHWKKLLIESLLSSKNDERLDKVVEEFLRFSKVKSILYMIGKVRKEYIKILKEKVEKKSDYKEITIFKSNVSRNSIIYSENFSGNRFDWSIKIRSDEYGKLGIFLCRKDSLSPLSSSCNKFLSFFTTLFNFQIGNLSITYGDAGIFSFPKNLRYLYGPSKICPIESLTEQFGPEQDLQIKLWIEDCIEHSALMHYFSTHFEQEIKSATDFDILTFHPKDLYSLLDSNLISSRNEDEVLKFVGKFCKLHKNDAVLELINSIKIQEVSTRTLLETLSDSYFKDSPIFSKIFIS